MIEPVIHAIYSNILRIDIKLKRIGIGIYDKVYIKLYRDDISITGMCVLRFNKDSRKSELWIDGRKYRI